MIIGEPGAIGIGFLINSLPRLLKGEAFEFK